MLKNNSKLRALALDSLKAKWGYAILVTILCGLISIIVSSLLGGGGKMIESVFTSSEVVNKDLFDVNGDISWAYFYSSPAGIIIDLITSFIYYLIMFPITWGFLVLFLNSFRGSKIDVGELFDGFNDYWRIVETFLLVYLYTNLWTLLLIIPGMIKSYSYSMTSYILKDELDLRNNAAIEKSMDMMSGNKMKLFLMDLGFIGLSILSVFTLFISLLWLMPYWYASRAAFYEDLKGVTDGVIESV